MIALRTIKKTVSTKKGMRDSFLYSSTGVEMDKEELKKQAMRKPQNGSWKVQKNNKKENCFRIKHNGVCALVVEDYMDLDDIFELPCGVQGFESIYWGEEDLLIIEVEHCYSDPFYEHGVVVDKGTVIKRCRNEEEFKTTIAKIIED